MTHKELKKLNRTQLIELLIEQGRMVDELSERLEECERRLEDRRIALESSGSIAEAALKLNGIFEAAQEAADQYLVNVKMIADEKANHKGSGSETAQSVGKSKPRKNKKQRNKNKA